MADGAVQTPRQHPREIIRALAFACEPAHIQSLAPKLEETSQGWSLLWAKTRGVQKASIALTEALGLKESALRSVDIAKMNAAGVVAPGDEMIRYLVHRDFSNEIDATPLSGERLVVVPDMAQSDMISILGKINSHATCVRAAVMEQVQGGNLTLFHLRDDPRRGSTLSAFMRAYTGHSVPVLKAFKTRFGVAFLPVSPPRDSLAGVAQLIHDVPKLFGRSVETPSGWKAEALLFAVARETGPEGMKEKYDTWYDIRNARFFGSAAYTQDRPSVQLAVPKRDPDASLRELQSRLNDPSAKFSQAVTLKSAGTISEIQRSDAELDAHIEALEADRRVIDRKLRAARSSKMRPSMLVVLPEAQFPAVAELLRQIITKRDSWEGIRYSYLPRRPGEAAQTEDETPFHLFHFGPDLAAEAKLRTGLRTFSCLEFYWSDPTWTAHYARSARVEVMVPWQMKLSPFPHSWDAAEIDQHLRNAITTWSDGKIELNSDAAELVVFAQRQGQDRELGVEVLRAADLRPLNGRTLVWFNTVLAQAGASQGDELRIDFENAEIRSQLAQARSERNAEVEAELAEAIAASKDQIDTAWSDFAQALETDLADRMKHISERTEAISGIEKQARKLDERFRETKRNIDKMREDAKSFAARTTKIPRTQSAEIDTFLKELSERDRKFNHSVEQANKQIDGMKTTLDRIRKAWFG